jgi:DNA-binding NarL/FixJ family response regulator
MSNIRNLLKQSVDHRKLPAEFPLTGRESQVLVHVALGLSNKEIARSLEISVETVKEHVQNILRKIKANDRTDAAVRAVRLGIVD